MRIKQVMVLAALCAAAGLAGCGHEESAGPPPTPPPAVPPSESSASPGKLTREDLDAVAKSTKPFKLVLIVKTRNNPFFEPMIRAATEEAKALGVELEV